MNSGKSAAESPCAHAHLRFRGDRNGLVCMNCSVWWEGDAGEGDRFAQPIPMLLTCPVCNKRHIDEGDFATKVHHTHACQHCGTCWRPAVVATVGVQFLPGFKNV